MGDFDTSTKGVDYDASTTSTVVDVLALVATGAVGDSTKTLRRNRRLNNLLKVSYGS